MDSLLGDGACHALDQFKCKKLVDVQDVKIISRVCMRNVKHGGIGMNCDTREQAASSNTGSIKVTEAVAPVCLRLLGVWNLRAGSSRDQSALRGMALDEQHRAEAMLSPRSCHSVA